MAYSVCGMKRLRYLLATMLLSVAPVWAQNANAPQTILLWPNGAPGAQGDTDADKPALTIYPVTQNHADTGIVVFPGGGYQNLAMDHEGKQIAEWLNHLGIPAFVLRYRLGMKYRHPIELGDAQRAIRYVRAHAGEYGVNPQRLGIWGFSAGGHLASSAGTHFDAGKPDSSDPIDRQSSRPDFMILAYPVITMREPYVHRGSREHLLGAHPPDELVNLMSNELQVTKDTPPAFLFHTSDDPVVPVQNSIEFYLALRKAGVPAEMHIFEHGRHGVGLAKDDPALSIWPTLLANWLKARGLRP
jgi:acetyl esterase/lipase